MKLNEAQKEALNRFFDLKDREGNRVRAGSEFVYAVLEFRHAIGQRKGQYQDKMDHLYERVEPHLETTDFRRLTTFFADLALNNYDHDEIKKALKEYERDLKKSKLTATTS